MISSGNWTPDLLILSSKPYLLDHMLLLFYRNYCVISLMIFFSWAGIVIRNAAKMRMLYIPLLCKSHVKKATKMKINLYGCHNGCHGNTHARDKEDHYLPCLLEGTETAEKHTRHQSQEAGAISTGRYSSSIAANREDILFHFTSFYITT